MRFLVLLLTCTLMLPAGTGPERVAWDETPEVFAGRRVYLQLDGGTKVEGFWIAVTADSFTMKIVKTSSRDQIGTGVLTLPRSAVIGIKARAGKPRVRGRVIGTVAGFYGATGIAYAATRSREAAQTGWGFGIIAGAVLGYLAGSDFDHAPREIILLP